MREELAGVLKMQDLRTLAQSLHLTRDQFNNCRLVRHVFKLLLREDPSQPESSRLERFLDSGQNRLALSRAEDDIFTIVNLETPPLNALEFSGPGMVEAQLAKLETPIQKLDFVAKIVESAVLGVY